MGLTRSAVLHPHPESRVEGVRAVTARILRTAQGLEVRYAIEGDIGRLRVPPRAIANRADRLWERTCCEMFVATPRSPAYHELNFSPSGEWAAYSFSDYRAGRKLEEPMTDPRISVEQTEQRLLLEASSASLPFRGTLTIGLSVVLEDREGRLSYWALRHPPGKPDFHHPGAFALELDEVRD